MVIYYQKKGGMRVNFKRTAEILMANALFHEELNPENTENACCGRIAGLSHASSYCRIEYGKIEEKIGRNGIHFAKTFGT